MCLNTTTLVETSLMYPNGCRVCPQVAQSSEPTMYSDTSPTSAAAQKLNYALYLYNGHQ